MCVFVAFLNHALTTEMVREGLYFMVVQKISSTMMDSLLNEGVNRVNVNGACALALDCAVGTPASLLSEIINSLTVIM